MRKIGILFYRPDFDGHLLDDAIANWTRLWNPQTWFKGILTSHVEVWTTDEDNQFVVDGKVTGLCWTSTMSDGKNRKYDGVRVAQASEVLKHPERWFVFFIYVPEIDYYIGLHWMEQEVRLNAGYDKIDILSFFTPIRFGNPKKFICSGFVSKYLFLISLCRQDSLSLRFCELYSKDPSPLRLAGWLLKCGLKPISLIDHIKQEEVEEVEVEEAGVKGV